MSETTCGWCAETVPADATTCPHCQGNIAAGREYLAEKRAEASARVRPAAARTTAGAGKVMLVQRPKVAPLKFGDRPEGLMWGSLFLAIGFGVLAGMVWIAAGDTAGVIAVAAGAYFTSALFLIGLIAKGVELGIRAARHRQDLDF